MVFNLTGLSRPYTDNECKISCSKSCRGFATNIGADKEDGLQANCEPQHRSQGVSGTGTVEFGVRTLSIRSQQ